MAVDDDLRPGSTPSRSRRRRRSSARSSTFRLTAPGMWPCRGSQGAPKEPSYSSGLAHVDDRHLAEPRRRALELDVAHVSAPTTSSSRATDGRAEQLLEPRARRAPGSSTPSRSRSAQHPRHVRDVDEEARARPAARRAAPSSVVRLAAPERVVVVAEQRRRSGRPRAAPARAPPASAGSSAGAGIPLLEVLHDHGRLGQDEAVVEDRHLARSGSARRPTPGRLREVDLDRLVRRAPFSARTIRTRAQ